MCIRDRLSTTVFADHELHRFSANLPGVQIQWYDQGSAKDVALAAHLTRAASQGNVACAVLGASLFAPALEVVREFQGAHMCLASFREDCSRRLTVDHSSVLSPLWFDAPFRTDGKFPQPGARHETKSEIAPERPSITEAPSMTEDQFEAAQMLAMSRSREAMFAGTSVKYEQPLPVVIAQESKAEVLSNAAFEKASNANELSDTAFERAQLIAMGRLHPGTKRDVSKLSKQKCDSKPSKQPPAQSKGAPAEESKGEELSDAAFERAQLIAMGKLHPGTKRDSDSKE
eukprot:TRINITY_DN38853_c0_g1_i2.p1 TRINITY_DN38853_c0_g1~~TRINITY_DN38853_c0_g1_i2.p1  ORF type:complete len:287 (-),score=48.14 TRINITY_DN38853_c0_g1_i2:231-1091(-)